MSTSFIPESAPFNEEQRAWLNGFFAGMIGINPNGNTQAMLGAAGVSIDSLAGGTAVEAEPEEEDFPWHDAALPIVDRMEMAEGRPLERRLMAAMAQLDCGSCGYLCQTYSEAIASGEETNLTLCSPGGKETSKMIKKVLKDGGDNGAAKPAASNGTPSNGVSTNGFSRKNPYRATLIESRALNLEGSAKDTRHVAIDLGSSGVSYEVGDALGVYATNCDDLVNQIIHSIGAKASMMVVASDGTPKTLATTLAEDFCLKDPSDELLEMILGRIDDSQTKATLARMLEEGVPEGFDVLDVLELAQGTPISATEFLEMLAPLNPRLYSIASSQKHVGNQVHLTVGKVFYEREGRIRKGVASTMLADRLQSGQNLRVFVQPNHGGFTVPSDPSTPMIMIGPGTGIAPFMAFLQEREATKAHGKNWLFFGDQHESTDFLYEAELKRYQETGLLTRLDTAFSRDGEQKVYVQDRMREHGEMLWQWLNENAHIYVCGDASRMAVDVDRALKQVIAQYGKMDDAAADQFVKQMSQDNRYVRDVY
ncbi:sulfite reductase subunit alpha [Rhodopirellula sp. MGV]|uniref:sulfite reductase subunit alpha n=1 Tax=Rhodopirellula sp. MGV TaxID=2023130 RepID=UPI000B96CDCF|nr:sulfite reductase subunit alpha [Rhodopirellula sp. MGV]OYP38213.1 sulfite reductase [Rhodopirellula sp. MGV]PNY38550.1 sulfite reductase subunit alpha [Rhodopirellula baltica]